MIYDHLEQAWYDEEKVLEVVRQGNVLLQTGIE